PSSINYVQRSNPSCPSRKERMPVFPSSVEARMKILTDSLGSSHVRSIPPLSQSRHGDMACQALYVRKHVRCARQDKNKWYEQPLRVCELAGQLSFNNAMTRTLIGESAGGALLGLSESS